MEKLGAVDADKGSDGTSARKGARRTGLRWRSLVHQVRDARTTTRMQGRPGQRAGLLLLADGHRCEDGCPRRLGRGEVGSMDLEVSVVAGWCEGDPEGDLVEWRREMGWMGQTS